jgi:membrane-associated phospholipid phosphatase
VRRECLRRSVDEARRLDRAVYRAVAGTRTPVLDAALSRLSRAADYSRLSLAAAGVLALSDGERGRRGAARGLASVAVTATVVNMVLKPLTRRRRPRVVYARPLVRMPRSRSFPSGHTAAAFAFATAVARVLPAASLPLYALAGLVGYSRVHTGVHYPLDALFGAFSGVALAELTNACLDRLGEVDQPTEDQQGAQD